LDAAEGLCAAGPVALCADDLHHADGDSLSVLGRLASSTGDLPLALVLARRTRPVRDALVSLAARPDVHPVEVRGLDDAGLDQLVTLRFQAPAGPALRSLLSATGGNPFHAEAMLDELARHGRLQVTDGQVVVSGDLADAPLSVQAGVRAHLTMVDAPTRDLLQVLAVWGRQASIEQLAAVTGALPISLLGPVQAAVDSGVARWTDNELLAFTHDLYRDVIYADLAAPLRRMLHQACAAQLRVSGGISTQIAQHSGDAAGGTDPALALRTAAEDLAYAPAQAADLLAEAALHAEGGPYADPVAIARAGALAAAGQMAEAEKVAGEQLRQTTDTAARGVLLRLMLHAMVSAADTAGAIAAIDEGLDASPDVTQQEMLINLRRWTLVLAGAGPVVTGLPEAGPPGAIRQPGRRTGGALVPAAMELFLQARCEQALELAVEARDVREASGSPVWADGATAPVWPAWFALYARGPEAAGAISVEARRHAQERGRGWLASQHLFVAATIDQFAGRWDDAIAEWDTGLEAATMVGSGWMSRAVGGLLQVRVRRGELAAVAAGIDQWKLRGQPNQFGLPMVELVEILLAEAQGRAGQVRELARRTWGAAMDGGRVLWALLAGPEIARLALIAGDEELLGRVAADTAAVPVEQAAALAPAADLVRAMAEADPDRAVAAAADFRRWGSAGAENDAWEEAAVASAARGAPDDARQQAGRCLELAAGLGAVPVERRLTARLRSHGVRLGVSGVRRRPASGWGSLTPTELQVAELVGQGMTSPQIATRLFISPRTVQTHISHSLRKLDLSSRVELATTVTRHQA
ncbi:MAG: LuxR C-terminal-related transcriptional regulator, partial [Nakamurella sp.]